MDEDDGSMPGGASNDPGLPGSPVDGSSDGPAPSPVSSESSSSPEGQLVSPMPAASSSAPGVVQLTSFGGDADWSASVVSALDALVLAAAVMVSATIVTMFAALRR